jgi:uroporphyrinogen-III synthase
MTFPAPLRVCSFESRRAVEMRSLLERAGATATVAPSMREVPLESNVEAMAFARRLLADPSAYRTLILLTGVGTRTLFESACLAVDRGQFVAALNNLMVVVRGPKPLPVLREWGVHVDHRAPEPNTWREVVTVFREQSLPTSPGITAVQEYGRPTPELYSALTELGATVEPIPVYGWDLPEDVGPLHAAIRATIHGDFDALMFTSAQQVRNILQAAADLGLESDWLAAAKRCVLLSIGPTTTETLLEHKLESPFEPAHAKMGPLVLEGCAHAREVLRTGHRV